MSAADFGSELELLKNCIRGWGALTARVGEDTERKTLPGNAKFGRNELRTMLHTICAHIDRLGKVFRASAGRGKRAGKKDDEVAAAKRGAQLKRLFYVSDQLVEFIREVNKGNGLAVYLDGVPAEQRGQWARANGADPAVQAQLRQLFDAQGGLDALVRRAGGDGTTLANADVNVALEDLLYRNRMANSTILVTVLHLVVQANGLQSVDNGQRVHYDATWLKYFGQGDSHYRLLGTDLSQAVIDTLSGLSPVDQEARLSAMARSVDELTKLKEHLSECDASSFQRIASGPAIVLTRQQQKVPFPRFIDQSGARGDDWGILYAMFMVIISHNHIPTYLVGDRADALASRADAVGNEANPNVVNAQVLKEYISSLRAVHTEAAKPEKRRRREAASRATREQKSRAKAATRAGAALPVPAVPALPMM